MCEKTNWIILFLKNYPLQNKEFWDAVVFFLNTEEEVLYGWLILEAN